MAAVLSNNMSDIKQVSFYGGCRNGTQVLGPDVNESLQVYSEVTKTHKDNLTNFLEIFVC
jgi:hypothetical protein